MREPEAVFWIFIFPLILAVGLGLAFRNRPADVLPVAATTRTPNSLASDKGLTASITDESAGKRALATGEHLLLAIQTPDGVIYSYDDTNPDARDGPPARRPCPASCCRRSDRRSTTNDLVHEKGSRYIDFVVPGLLGMNLMGPAIWGLGFAIVEARQKKLLKRLVASPMPKWQYLASFLFSRLIMLAIEVVVFLGFAPSLSACHSAAHCGNWHSSVFAFAEFFLPWTADRLACQDDGSSNGLMNLAMLPMWILSGVFFSASRFPAFIQPFVAALPLTAAINTLRGNMLQGLSLAQMTAPIAILLAWLIIPFAVSLRIFRWR